MLNKNTAKAKAPAAAPPAAAAEIDLSAEIVATVDALVGETVRCIRVYGDHYRCNWWGPESASTNMARRYGRAPRGERLRASVPHGHWKTTTFVAGLRRSGLTAPFVLDGPINGVWFQAYVDQVLIPTLRKGDIVVMDNLGSHKGAQVRRAIEAAGANLLYLPPYSPDFNPIEKAFSKLKASCERPPSEPSTASGTGSANYSKPSRQANAQTSSPPLDMTRFERKPL